jgi:hypothetical protein
VGAQLSEVLNDEVTSSEEAGFSRRRVVKGVAWSVPVIVAAVGAPPASASPGPTPTPTATPATAAFTAAPQTMTSTVSGSHDRINVVVPAKLALKDLAGATGTVKVELTITGALICRLSTVQVGSVSVSPVVTGAAVSPFKATFSSVLAAGATQLEFTLGGYSYNGKKQDAETLSVAALITFQQGGQTKQLTPTSTIVLVRQ